MAGKILRGVMTLLLMIVIGAAFYVAVILGEPQAEQRAVKPLQDQPLLGTSSPVSAAEESGLAALRNAFPAPVLQSAPGSGLTFVSGESRDAAFEDGYGRIVTLRYRNQAGQELTVVSVYPARALSLIGKADYVLADVTGQTLAGMKSVRMENETHIRLHVQAEEAIYAVTLPLVSQAELINVTRSLQLFEGE